MRQRPFKAVSELPPGTVGSAVRNAGSKVRSLDELAEISRAEKLAGRTVVMAHGVFDLVHLGHVRHLRDARRQGDLLIVTITADRFVNKGPNRPVFAEHLRAEMLAALEQVDWVGINDAPTAEPILRSIAPNVYVKGPDYASAANDITGGIDIERRMVEAHGGRLFITDDISFSSSNLINRHLGVYDRRLAEYLDTTRDEGRLPRLIKLIESVKDYRVLLVGDAIIDEYSYVTAMNKSPKENMIATLIDHTEVFAGGVIAAANHVASFCRKVDIVTSLGRESSREEEIRSSQKSNVGHQIVWRETGPTTSKRRFVELGHLRKLFEVYSMDDTPLSGAAEQSMCDTVARMAPDYDLVIVTDFGHGAINQSTIDALQDRARFLAVNAQTNSANYGFNMITRYDRADYICIDAPEARLAAQDKHNEIPIVIEQGLRRRIDCDRLIITHGRNGCVTRDRDGQIGLIPAFTGTVVDTVGAGDAFLAVTSPLVATGAPMQDVGFIGNAAGAMKVGIIGHSRSVEKVPLMKFVTSLLR